MVTRWGLSERLGPLTYGEEEGEVFLGHSMNKRQDISDETAHVIDEEIRLIVDRAYLVAKDILERHQKELHIMAEALLKYETINMEQIKVIMEGKFPPEPSDWNMIEPPMPPKDSDSTNSTSNTSTTSTTNGTQRRNPEPYENPDPAN